MKTTDPRTNVSHEHNWQTERELRRRGHGSSISRAYAGALRLSVLQSLDQKDSLMEQPCRDRASVFGGQGLQTFRCCRDKHADGQGCDQSTGRERTNRGRPFANKTDASCKVQGKVGRLCAKRVSFSKLSDAVVGKRRRSSYLFSHISRLKCQCPHGNLGRPLGGRGLGGPIPETKSSALSLPVSVGIFEKT